MSDIPYMTPPGGADAYLVPAWHYQPVPPFMYRLADGQQRVLMQGQAADMDCIAGLLGQRCIPARHDQVMYVIDGNHHIVFGWNTVDEIAYFGVAAFFEALGTHVDPMHLLELEMAAKGLEP